MEDRRYDSFRPGRTWLDSEGKPIQAHGGSILYEQGTYYWYGENKELTDGINGIWHNGVRCYSSKDLYNWNDEGIIIPPEEDEKSTLHRSAGMDRPHIVYNEKNRKYICWLKIMEKDGSQSMTVLIADNLLGPYKKVREHFKPFGMSCGDFDLAKASDGTVYWYFEKVHSELICAELSEDYCDVKENYSVHFPHPEGIPFVREAPAHFERRGIHYLITSGTSGYYPNPSEAASAKTYHGPFEILGNPHLNDVTDTSFHSQISSVFKVPSKKDLYIALADRWLPDAMDIPYEKVRTVFEFYSRGMVKEAREVMNTLDLKPENTSKASYIWLPVRFENDRPVIRWYDSWRLEDYQ